MPKTTGEITGLNLLNTGVTPAPPSDRVNVTVQLASDGDLQGNITVSVTQETAAGWHAGQEVIVSVGDA